MSCFLKSTETIKYLKETSDTLQSMIGKLAIVNSVFLFKIQHDLQPEKSIDFENELKAINEITCDIDNNINFLSLKIDLIEKSYKK